MTPKPSRKKVAVSFNLEIVDEEIKMYYNTIKDAREQIKEWLWNNDEFKITNIKVKKFGVK